MDVVNILIRIHALDDVSKDIVGNMVKMDSRFTWTEKENQSPYACLSMKK